MDFFSEKQNHMNIDVDALFNVFSGYKGIVCVIIAVAAVTGCLILFFLNKRSVKNYIFTFLVAAVCAAFMLLTDFQSTESFYGNTERHDVTTGVTLSVRCDMIVGRDGDYIPDDGCIIPETVYTVSQGDTVYDVLVRAVREYSVQLECDGATGDNTLAYVKGINYIYEFDYGELSGWVFHVNGSSPSVGCGAYTVSDGDVIEWLYTLELGNDIGTEAAYEAT